jgi:K+-transporting ATPase KdpF subunit
MVATLGLITVRSSGMDFTPGYVVGAIIGFFILGYLVYSLIKPEKF